MRTGKQENTFDGAGPTPNISKFTVGGGVAGLLTTVIFVVIGLIGLPSTRWFLAGAVVLGGMIALVLHFAHRDHS
jgi:hypothetical protein